MRQKESMCRHQRERPSWWDTFAFIAVVSICFVPAGERSSPVSFCRSFDCAVEEWRQLHCDMNDLSQWLTDTERLMSKSVGPDGRLELDSARQHQEVSGG